MTDVPPSPESRATRLPAVEGCRAFRLFCTPSRSRHRSPDHEALVARARFHVRSAPRQLVATPAGDVVVHVLEPDAPARGTVMVVHGWTSEASFMAAIGDYLRRRGWRVLLPDLPAHGTSPGRRVSLIGCAQAVQAVARAFGPVRHAVAHSMGGLAAMLAGRGGVTVPLPSNFASYALIAVPDRFQDTTRAFGAEQGLGAAAQRHFERRLERLASRRVVTFTGRSLLADTGRAALLLHAPDDDAVPFADAERIAAAVPQARLEACPGLGHRAILYAPTVVRAIAAFIDDQDKAAG